MNRTFFLLHLLLSTASFSSDRARSAGDRGRGTTARSDVEQEIFYILALKSLGYSKFFIRLVPILYMFPIPASQSIHPIATDIAIS